MYRFTLLLLPALAVADTRLDLAPIPELMLLEPAHHLDRGSDKRTQSGVIANVGVGYAESEAAAESTVAAGVRNREMIAGASSELVAVGGELVRGRHQGLLEMRVGSGTLQSTTLTFGTSLEHGESRALAPVALGPGRRNHGEVYSDALIALERDKSDFVMSTLVHAGGSATTWTDSPLLDSAYRGSLGLGIAFVPDDGEIPRGRLDAIAARVEHATINRKLAAAGIPLRPTVTRTVELMAGPNELAGYIDHEMLFAVTARVGAKWVESDVERGTMSETLFAMDLGAHFKWLEEHQPREIGFAFARSPTTSPDGQHIVTDWRLELLSTMENEHLVLGARGGLSWITHQEGAGDASTLKRYAIGLDAFVKVVAGIEVGAYHTRAFEPQVAGDPWSAPREWSLETGVLARWRPRTY